MLGVVACTSNLATRWLWLGDCLRTEPCVVPCLLMVQSSLADTVAPNPDCQVGPNKICDLLWVSYKTYTNLFMVECWWLNWLPPPGPPGVEGVWTWTLIEQDSIQNLPKGEGACGKPTTIHICANGITVDILLQLVTFPRRLVTGFALQSPQNTSLHKTHCNVSGWCWGVIHQMVLSLG